VTRKDSQRLFASMSSAIVKVSTLPEELQGIRSAPSVPKEERIYHDLASPATDTDPRPGTPLSIVSFELEDKSSK
jgi:hypothetical protein